MDDRKVAVYGTTWRGAGAKTRQLWMTAIALYVPAENSPSEQCFTPKRDQPLRVEVLGMKGPQSHPQGGGAI